jgi:hypothetical protein
MDDVSDLVERTRRAEASVSAMVDRVGLTVDRVKTVALAKIWPAAGMARGLRSVASAIRERRRRRKHDLDIEETAEERFIGEGGASARPVGTR